MIQLIKVVSFLRTLLRLRLLLGFLLGFLLEFLVFCCCAAALTAMVKFTLRLGKVRLNER